MSILLSDLKLYAAAVTPEDDVVTAIGGAIDQTKKYDFSDIVGACQGVSSAAGDTTQTITVTYRTAAGAITTLAIALNGTTVVTNAAEMGRVLKAVKSATCAGDVAVEFQTAEITGTLDGLGVALDQVILASGASSGVGYYNGMVLRATSGLGQFEIAEIIDYSGPTRIATLSRNVSTIFDATTVYRISKGVFFDKTPTEILTVVRMDYNSAADPPGGVDRNFYQKGYWKHTDASASGLTLNTCTVRKISGNARIAFAIDTSLNGSGTNGVGNNRQVAPSTGVSAFGTADIATPGDATMAPADYIGMWMRLEALDGALALNETWVPSLQGQTV